MHGVTGATHLDSNARTRNRCRIAHALAITAASRLPDRLAAVVAGSVYVPLMPFRALGLPVFGTTMVSGWASPSSVGWGLLLAMWVGFWWVVVAGVVRILRQHRQDP
jgi:hypothetical protein